MQIAINTRKQKTLLWKYKLGKYKIRGTIHREQTYNNNYKNRSTRELHKTEVVNIKSDSKTRHLKLCLLEVGTFAWVVFCFFGCVLVSGCGSCGVYLEIHCHYIYGKWYNLTMHNTRWNNMSEWSIEFMRTSSNTTKKNRFVSKVYVYFVDGGENGDKINTRITANYLDILLVRVSVTMRGNDELEHLIAAAIEHFDQKTKPK